MNNNYDTIRVTVMTQCGSNQYCEGFELPAEDVSMAELQAKFERAAREALQAIGAEAQE